MQKHDASNVGGVKYPYSNVDPVPIPTIHQIIMDNMTFKTELKRMDLLCQERLDKIMALSRELKKERRQNQELKMQNEELMSKLSEATLRLNPPIKFVNHQPVANYSRNDQYQRK